MFSIQTTFPEVFDMIFSGLEVKCNKWNHTHMAGGEKGNCTMVQKTFRVSDIKEREKQAEVYSSVTPTKDNREAESIVLLCVCTH